MAYKPTDEQVAVLDSFTAGNNVSVSAYAGAGKTSTLVQAAASAPRRRGIFTAFNKKIITDSAQKFGINVRCQTTHALASHVLMADGGWRRGRLKAPRIHGRRLAQLLGVNDPISLDGGQRILHPSRLASLAVMMVDRYANSGDDHIGWWHMPFVPGIEDAPTRRIVGTALVPAARKAWADATNPNGVLRYTHNYYRKEYALTHPRIECDFIMLDEAQDSAGVLVRLMQDQAEHGTQIITVGDSYQQINAWTGAIDAMDKFEGDKLYLTQSFRFGSAIADEANKWLELLGAPVPLRGFDGVDSRLVPDYPTPNAVLCRTNGAVVQEVIDRLTKGERVAMLGNASEITDFTRGARDLQERAWSAHPDLMAFSSWGQLQDYVENDDAGADLKVMVDMIDKHGVDRIEDAMRNLAPSNRADVVLSTAHKCKGAEWDAVRIGTDFKAPKPDATGQRRVPRDAAMLNYVAITRAKKVLDRGSLSWVDEFVAEHRQRHETPDRISLGVGGAVLVVDQQATAAARAEDPEVIAVGEVQERTLVPGDTLGPHVVVDTGDGQLGTVMPVDLETVTDRPAAARGIVTRFASTPVAIDGPDVPQWVKDGLPGSDWTVEEWEEVQRREADRFDRGLTEAIDNAPEAPIDPLIAETAPTAPKVQPVLCGAEHKTWLNTVCRLEPHGPEVLHQDLGVEWDDSRCKTLGVAPANA